MYSKTVKCILNTNKSRDIYEKTTLSQLVILWRPPPHTKKLSRKVSFFASELIF
jgi:hypothetical protein